jgi:hypothetical protein
MATYELDGTIMVAKARKGKNFATKEEKKIVSFSLSCVARSYHMEWLKKSSILGANHNTLQQIAWRPSGVS